ncbi:MAG: acetyl-CoA decarbonylase/synthase complex subunit gamma, partial [Planctomycetes bacterium]|nr:acetyl-CoA decarbonylase/synthase complex subunit gamma [Planctomycetota bacterium]
MALTGLDIFKLLPKSNCKKCGMPTCLAFAMQLAQKKAKLDDCPCASEEARESLSAAAAPPMRQIKFGSGDNQVSAGQETVLFRHDEKFYSPTIVAVTVSDKLTGDELQKRVDTINALQFERVGCKIGVTAIAVVNDSGEADAFAVAAAKTDELSDLALILCSDSPEAMAAATAKTSGSKPLIASATLDTVEAMAKIAKESKCPIVAKAGSLSDLEDLTIKIVAQGVEDIVLSFDGMTLEQELRSLTDARE